MKKRKAGPEMVKVKDRRHFIRHPICYPLEVEYAPKKLTEKTRTINVSKGGLLFISKHPMKVGAIIILKMPLRNKVFNIRAKVMHIEIDRDDSKLYDIGIAFYRYTDAFKVKLIEQIYLIDEYRILRSIQLGRDISFNEASGEWIKRYSKRFAKLYW
jgi:Tfp pilus assembly protein PilZ